MGKLTESLDVAVKLAERLARAGGDFNSATQAGGVSTPQTSPSTIIFNVHPTQGSSSPGGRIGGSGVAKKLALDFEDEDFRDFLLSRGVTQKHLLENVQFMAALRAEFERLKADLIARGFDILLRGGGG